MISKTLIGWMLVLGPIAGVILILLEPSAASEDFAVNIQASLDNPTLARVTAIGITVAISTIFIGTIFFARSMAEAQKPGSNLAAIGSILVLFSAVANRSSKIIESSPSTEQSKFHCSGTPQDNATTIQPSEVGNA